MHPALIAAVIAWGAKFSENTLLLGDRNLHGGSSRLARTLMDRTRELSEHLKVHRVPTTDHVVVCTLLEPLQPQNLEDNAGFHGFWLRSAVRHMFDLQINHKNVIEKIRDTEARETMIFAWWMSCLADGFGSAYYRRKPLLDDEDYDIDLWTEDIASNGSPAGQTEQQKVTLSHQLQYLGYFRTAHALARIARLMSRKLWGPAVESDGILPQDLFELSLLLQDWGERYLQVVGVPSAGSSANPAAATRDMANWGFINAISACASDATYKVMWVIMWNAVDDFGIRDWAGLPPDSRAKVTSMLQKLNESALDAALTISGLAGVLADNGYLRLDPAVMHVSCIYAGTLLARFGRPEYTICVRGLEQYGFAYEEVWEQIKDMHRSSAAARVGDWDFIHMAAMGMAPGNQHQGGAGAGIQGVVQVQGGMGEPMQGMCEWSLFKGCFCVC